MRNGYLVKILPPVGHRVFRLSFTRRHVVFGAALLAIVLATLGGAYVWALYHAEIRVGQLRSLTDAQQSRLQQIDEKAAALDSELRSIRTQNEQTRKMIDAGRTGGHGSHLRVLPRAGGAQSYRPDDSFAQVAARIENLRGESLRVRDDGNRLRGLALHVLNVRRLQDIARERVLAAIPSLNPGGENVAIRSPYGWRVDPWPEFHQGVDLDVDYGDPVRAAGTGTVVAAGYEGGYGIKVDIDHGNGYHTWYCHLSRADVHAGERVKKGEHIALVGSTGLSTGPHLHYQIMLDGAPVDPTPYLTGVPGRVLASLK